MKSPFVGGHRSALLSCASLCAILPAFADSTWTGAVDASWANTANWLEGALPAANDTVLFDANSTGNLASISLGANRVVRGLSVSNPASDVTIVAGSNLSLTHGIDLGAASANLTINSTLTLGDSSNASVAQVWNVVAGRNLSVAAVPLRNSGYNDLRGAGVIDLQGAGAVKLGAAAASVVADAGGNPFVTIGGNDWAATDATGNVTTATYNDDTFSSNANIVTPGTYAINGAGTSSTRFANTEGEVTVNNSNTSTLRGILVAPGAQSVTINGGFVRPNRSSTAGATFSIIQNSTDGDLTIGSSIPTASSSTPVTITKSGPGKLIFTGGNGNNGRTFIHEGTLQVGNGGTSGSLHGGHIINHATLIFDRSDDLTQAHIISGAGTLTKNGDGALTLGNDNTYTGATTVNGGLLALAGDGSIGSSESLTLAGGGIRWNAATDISWIPEVTIAGTAILDTNGNDIALWNTVGNSGNGSVTKTGGGTLTLAAANTWTGGATVAGGVLIADNGSTGSATGSGPVEVASGGTLGGEGTVGPVTVSDGGRIAPGTPGLGVGTLTTGSLALSSGSLLTIEFGASANDRVRVFSSGGLSIGGGSLTLYQQGTTTAFSAPGTYQLFQYSGAIGGAGVSALSVANPQPGYTYNFGASGGFVTLTIGTSGAVSHWNVNGGGTWNSAGNWNGGIPNGAGATANFHVALSAPATITLDGARTVGSITFLSGANGYTIAAGSGGSLVLNNGANPAAIVDGGGVHTISAPVTLATNTVLSTEAAGDAVTLGGIVSGSATLRKTGPGSLSLLAANTLTGTVTLSDGATTFANGGLGSGSLVLNDTTLAWAPGNAQDISNRAITFGDEGAVAFDTGDNDVLLANPFGGFGDAGLVKRGEGRLTLAGDTEFFGDVTIAAGTLQLGNSGDTGSVFGDIVNYGTLELKLASGGFVPNVISGSGNLVHSGSGTTDLIATNTFAGTTSIVSGTLALMNGQALQNSTLLYDNAGGTLDVSALSAVTLGALAGNKDIALTDGFEGPIALTVGGNGEPATYSGKLAGAGSLIKTGAAVFILQGANSYAGTTTVTGGTGSGALELNPGATIMGGPVTVTGNSRLSLYGGSIDSTGVSNIANTGTTAATFELFSGSASFETLNALGNQNIAHLIRVDGGTLNAGSISLGRSALNFSSEPVAGATDVGLYVNGGDVATGDLLLGNAAGVNSSANLRIDGGNVTVNGLLSIGLNNGGRWSVADVNGGTLVSTSSEGGIRIGGPLQGNAALIVNAGTAVAERIQFGFPDGGTEEEPVVVTGTHVLRLAGGELTVGAGGLVDVSSGNDAIVRLTGGTLGAKADWSTDIPVETSGLFEIRAANASNAAHDITFSGPVTGTGSLMKSGAGTLALTGGYSYTGATIVDQGILQLDNSTGLNDEAEVEVWTGAKLRLNHGGVDIVGSFLVDGIPQASETGIFDSTTHPNQIEGSGKLRVVAGSPYDAWIAGFEASIPNAGDREKGADPDEDGLTNLEEFALDGNPASAAAGKVRARIETVGGSPALVITLPVRKGAGLSQGAPFKTMTVDKVKYTIRGSNDLANFDQVVHEIIPASAAGMQDLSDNDGWEYRSFRLDGAIGTRGPKGFLDIEIEEEP